MFYVFIFNFHKKSKYVKQFKYSQDNFAGGVGELGKANCQVEHPSIYWETRLK